MNSKATVWGTVPIPAGTVQTSKTTKSSQGTEFAMGYAWSPNFRGEIEYLFNRVLNYSTSVTSSLAPVSCPTNFQLENKTLLINLYYDFTGFDRLIPFLCIGGGAAANKLTPLQTSSSIPISSPQIVGFAYAIGAGFRMQIFSRWFINLSYRYINLGNIKVESRSIMIPAIKLEGKYNQSALSFGLIYFF